MEITVHSSKSVKPDYSGHRSDDGGAAAEIVQLSVFDKVSYDEYITGVCAFHPPAPPNAALEAGLAAALAVYPEWAGRLVAGNATGGRAIVLNDGGARYVEATADVELTRSVVLELTTGGASLLSLYPSCAAAAAADGDGDGRHGDGDRELLLAQVTRFRCGSIIIGVSMHHRVADGHAICAFLFAWGQATRGGAGAGGGGGIAVQRQRQLHDRSSLFAPRDPPRVEFDHRGNEFKPHGGATPGSDGGAHAAVAGDDDEVAIHRVHFSKEWITALKSAVADGATAAADAAPPTAARRRRYTTLQCVAAHLWRCITAARGLDDAGDENETTTTTTTRMRIAVNGRSRMKNPPVPAGYTGNAVLWAWPATTARELVRQPIRDTVELISKEIAGIDDAYFRSFIDFAAGAGAVERERLEPTADSLALTLSPDVEVDSLLGIPFYEMDFAGARPFFFVPGYSTVPVDGFVFVVQSFEGEGSVDAYVPLFSRTMDAFKKICYSLQPMAI